MSEEKNDNLFVTTYIKRHEAVLLEHLRKQLEAEARNALFEMAVNEQNKQIEDQNNTIQSLHDTVEQSLNGIKSLTVEKESLNASYAAAEKEIQGLRSLYNESKSKYESEINNLHTRYNEIKNTYEKEINDLKSNVTDTNHINEKLVIAEREIAKLRDMYHEKNSLADTLEQQLSEANQRILTLENDNITLKNNYNIILKTLETQKEKETARPVASKKQTISKKAIKDDDSEWVDAD